MRRPPFLQFIGTAVRVRRRAADLRLDPDARLFAALFWYVLNRTAFGRHVYAIGDDPDAARLAGIAPTAPCSPSMSSPG